MSGILAGAAVLSAAWLGWPGVLLGLSLTAMFAPAGRWREVAGMLALAGGLAALMAARSVPPPQVEGPAWVAEARAVRGVVASAPSRGREYDTFLFRVSEAESAGQWRTAPGALCVIGPKAPVAQLGDTLWIPGEPVAIEDEPARFRAVMNARGCGGSLFARTLAVDAEGSGWRRSLAAARDGLSVTISSLAPGDPGALMSGLVTGADEGLSRQARDAFLETGTTHITAVSGSNFATLVTVLMAAGSLAGWRRTWWWLTLAAAGIWAYALLVGLEAPALRAAIVATGALLALRAGRRPDVMTLILLAGAAMALASPGIVWGLGFQLSLAASLALAATARFDAGFSVSAILSAAVATGAAQLATLPLLLPIRGDLPAASLPANLAIGPLVGVAFPLSAAAGLAAAAWGPLGEAIAIPAALAAESVISVVRWFAGIGGPLRTGPVGPAAGAIVAAGSVLACAALSEDGQRLWRQWPDRVAALGPARRAMLAGAAAGAVVSLALAATVR
ncbi:MAG: ComEC/Rec2 family competence protein [Chloroflexota bacterium]